MKTTASGDKDGGWIVDVHDGDRASTYTGHHETEAEAVAAALENHKDPRPNGPSTEEAEAKRDDELVDQVELVEEAREAAAHGEETLH